MAPTSGKRRISLPALPQLARSPSPLAALIVGAVCGALVVDLVVSKERSCDAVAGSSSCGGVGLLMLTVIFVGAYALGVLLLRMSSVDEPELTAFLGMMLPLVVVLLVSLTHAVFSPSMVLILPALSACSFAVGSEFTAALENSDGGPGRIRPQAQEKIPPADAAGQPAEPPKAPRHAPQCEPVADATQPLVVGARSAEDETTMLTAAVERQTAKTEPIQPEPEQPDPTQPGATALPSGEPEQPRGEPADPEADRPETGSGAADQDDGVGDEDRPSPWRRA